MQKWSSLRKYSQDYFNLVYKYYAACGTSYICTYYKFDIANSVIDKDILNAGSYSSMGSLSGNKWIKILFFPVYNVEQVNNAFGADERGFGKMDQITSFNFPNIYGINPLPYDHVHFEEIVLNPDDKSVNQGTLYQVKNIERATNTDITFWKVSLEADEHRKVEIENHLNDVYVFVDYEKRIYDSDKATCMFSLMEKNNKLSIDNYYKSSSGLYFNPVNT